MEVIQSNARGSVTGFDNEIKIPCTSYISIQNLFQTKRHMLLNALVVHQINCYLDAFGWVNYCSNNDL